MSSRIPLYADPTIGGVDAPIGVLGERQDTGTTYVKTGVLPANWSLAATAFGGLVSKFTGMALQVFTSSGTYTPTTGMKYCLVFATGGGGGGGGADTDGSAGVVAAGAGGGAGGTCIRLLTAAQIGASQAITRGAGGSGGAAAGASGSNGGNTTVGALMTANGGTGGPGSGTTTLTASAQVGGGGGSASSGDVNLTGGAGGMGLAVSCDGTTDMAIGFGGYGGASFWGGPGRQQGWAQNSLTTDSSNPGENGNAPGSGGSGAFNLTATGDMAGGNGANGIVVVLEFT